MLTLQIASTKIAACDNLIGLLKQNKQNKHQIQNFATIISHYLRFKNFKDLFKSLLFI